MDGAASQGWVSAALAVFFLAVGVRDLTSDPPNLDTATWELGLAAANALLFWAVRGGPGWAKTLGYGVFFGSALAAAADLFF